MSELRDLAAALSAISKSLTSIENHVASQDANCEQIRLGLHELRNQLQAQELERGDRELAIAQIQTWMGDFSKAQAGIHESVTTLQTTMADHRREIGQRIRSLEGDEATQP